MPEKSLPLIGDTHRIPGGVRLWRPLFQELKVCHLKNGNTAITFAQSHQAPVVFEFDADELEDFIDLLKNKEELAADPANKAQPATEPVAIGD